ncbi:magnesium transporter NIPA-domain-containing protein [Echria macrotheca]|uniref:Magnesium transporter NIPA-domain-containing protein n=1 Tax=Echria macrotheca TaxID=438768 RepID=A0AAJ0F7Y0_9PEZI|nr:magnesium transporter NIPA-domain-containing protein [Echria macrotheca]
MGLIDGLSPGGSIALGIVVGLMSTSVQSLGLTLQRKSHILEDEKGPYDARRPPYRRRRWQIGMGMFIISNVVGSSIQISMLPLPVLSTLQASGLVFNSICATLILGEPFTRWSLWGTLLVCSGAVLIAIFGAIPSPAHKLSELLELLGRRPFVIWMSFQAVIVVGIAVATEVVGQTTTLKQDPRFRLARGFAYGCISGILSAHSLLVAKSAVELIVRTIADGDNQFVHWQSWMLVIWLVTLALCQLYYLHRGLKLVSTSVLYPLIFCVYNIIAILDGLIYFRQTDLINPLRACLIALGTVILLSGVLALSWRLSDEQHTPGVGQSSLAPGLGMVEDTDGEEDEEDLLLASDLGDEEENAQSTQYMSYQTFRPGRTKSTSGEPSPLPPRKRPTAPSMRSSVSRWTEQAEIWDELEDRETPSSPSPMLNRRRSTTLPGPSESASLLFPRRSTTDFPSLAQSGDGTGGASAAVESPRRNFRRRRKSTGFPGFTARRPTANRKGSSGGLQEAVGGLWRLRWWGRGDKQKGRAASPRIVSSPAASPVGWTDRVVTGGGGEVSPTRRGSGEDVTRPLLISRRVAQQQQPSVASSSAQAGGSNNNNNKPAGRRGTGTGGSSSSTNREPPPPGDDPGAMV